MNTPPLIGLSGRRKVGKQIDGLPDTFSGVPVDLYLSDYAFGVTEAGGIPVHLPVEVDADALVERLDGLVLSGGADVDPAAYGEDTQAEVTTT